MRILFCAWLLLAISFPIGVQSRLFFPEEVVSLLSFVYSILPPFKVGKDSRIGAGFRVGPNADFQVLIELGPQTETQQLGASASSKREARGKTKSERKNRKSNLRKSLKRTKNITELPTTTITTLPPKFAMGNSTKLHLKAKAINSTKQEKNS